MAATVIVVFRTIGIRKKFDDGKKNLPQPKSLFRCSFDPTSYHFEGDQIYPRKFTEEQRVLTLIVSKIIENCLGIFVARRRIFHISTAAFIDNAEILVVAPLSLHNYL